MISLPATEIRQRLQRLRNYERAHPKLKEKYERKKEEVKKLKQEKKILEEKNKNLQKETEKIYLQLEELRALKFGKSRTRSVPKAKPLPGEENTNEEKKERKKRPAESYRRKKPPEEKVTDHLHLTLDQCSECGGEIIDTHICIAFPTCYNDLCYNQVQNEKNRRKEALS